MKTLGSFSIFLLCLSINALSGSLEGKIIIVKPDVYQIDYPNQIINIYFNYLPSDSFHALVSGIQVSPMRQEEIVSMIRDEVDRLPNDFIGKFLGIEIYPMHILAEKIMGYYSGGKIVLEISEAKLSSMYHGTFQKNFQHELAHHVYKQMEFRENTKDLMAFLKESQRLHPSKYVYKPTYMEYGYVSFYSAGGFGVYDPEEEFAELFAHLVCTDSREELLNYANEHPGSLLNEKITCFRAYLNNVIPSLNDDFFGDCDKKPLLATNGNHHDGETILATHEEKSNEIPNTPEQDEIFLADIEMMQKEVAEEFNNEFEIENSTESNVTENNYSNNKNEKPDYQFNNIDKPKKSARQKSTRKKKNRKGDGWLLSAFGIAIAVAAELLL